MKILLTGGTGMVGKALLKTLEAIGNEVHVLTRNKNLSGKNFYQWDVENHYIDKLAFEGVEVIIHLAGEGIFDKRWTEENKVKLYNSRVNSTKLLYDYLSKLDHQVKVLIGASAIGYYGINTKEIFCTEDSAIGDGFLANLVKDWEAEYKMFEGLAIRTIVLRFGIVLSSTGGALSKMLTPINWYLGAPIGNGNQFVSWIHLKDLIALIEFVMHTKTCKGIYNAVASNPVTNKELTLSIAQKVKKPLLLPFVPILALKIAFGNDKGLHLAGGNRVSNKKIKDEGFIFAFNRLNEALDSLLN